MDIKITGLNIKSIKTKDIIKWKNELAYLNAYTMLDDIDSNKIHFEQEIANIYKDLRNQEFARDDRNCIRGYFFLY